MGNTLKVVGGNNVKIGNNISVSGVINGKNNNIFIGDASAQSSINVNINGDCNIVKILTPSRIKSLSISCGNHIKANNTELTIGNGVTIEPGAKIFLYNSNNICHIGDNCLIATNLTIRCGESPHLIFDKLSGQYLDFSEGVFIGNHVWIGENVYVTKKVTIPDESIVAACSVVSKRFEFTNTVLAGNPASVVKKNVQWVRNYQFLEKGSVYKEMYDKWIDDLENDIGLDPKS